MCIVYCVLCIVYCVLCIVYCVLCIVYCVLCIVYCLLSIVYCVLCIVPGRTTRCARSYDKIGKMSRPSANTRRDKITRSGKPLTLIFGFVSLHPYLEGLSKWSTKNGQQKMAYRFPPWDVIFHRGESFSTVGNSLIRKHRF